MAKKNVRIQELDDIVSDLNENVEDLSTANAAQSEKINAQDKALHTAYYCFGTSKELKAQNILTKKGLFTKTKVLQDGFNRDYFITIDIREVTEIPLFAAKAKLQSNHPSHPASRMRMLQTGNFSLFHLIYIIYGGMDISPVLYGCPHAP